MTFSRSTVRNVFVVMAFVATGLITAMCEGDKTSEVTHSSGQRFAGSASCAACHADVVERHKETPHFLTSQVADTSTVMGSFEPGHNVVALTERLRILMENTEEGLFQRGVSGDSTLGRHPFDITIGSGRQGQTYLYWHGNSLFQLPASYYAPDSIWSNSPGYPTDQIVFNRPITARCLECHSTFFKIGRAVEQIETFDPKQVVLGVDCERCHGPAAKHVDFHTENPDAKEAKYVVNPARLTRVQRLDNCALCHSGIRNNFMPSFTFMVGDRLEEFSTPAYDADSAATLDVHGNQYGLLARSACFRLSEMDCSSCHDVHTRESANLKLFSGRCMSCHTPGSADFCKMEDVPGLVLEDNCIDCHMPKLPSRQVFVQASGNTSRTPFFVRTHLIGTYKAQVEKFLEGVRR
ncbi:MAG TPA: multiheme c-type cytochrome [Cyclobacteriaceae bacterium]|nr:multiheme c-type cytochrome [Cyclobacteriaceae bacterium]